MPSRANPDNTSSVFLSDVRDRQVCEVMGFALDAEDESRLKNMGFCVGRRIEVLQFGDPLIIKASSTNVGVARRLARGIEVRLDAANDPLNSAAGHSSDDPTQREPAKGEPAQRDPNDPLEPAAIA